MKRNVKGLTRRGGMIAAGNMILAFGLYQIHAQTKVTEGGVLGVMLLLENWFGISPAYSGLVLDAVCFFIGWRVLGNGFLGWSLLSTVTFSIAYRILELFPPLWPELYRSPLAAAVTGALFVGVGVGLSVRAGAACGGDDALTMALHKRIGWDIQWFYFITDGVVLLLSLTYIPWQRMLWSLLTCFLSGQIIGLLQKPLPFRKHSAANSF